MSRTFPLEITLSEFTEDTVNAVASEIEEAIENLRKYHSGDVTHITDVDIDRLLVKHHAAAVIWTADDIRKVIPRLNDDQALAVIAECFRHFSPDERANQELILVMARQFPLSSFCKDRSQKADKAFRNYSLGNTHENLLALLADARHWCDDNNECFDDLDRAAHQRYLEARAKTEEGNV